MSRMIREAMPLIAMLAGGAVMCRAQMALPLDGAKLFNDYCAACHGEKAAGGGPMAVALKNKVPDLTLIARRNGGVFPADEVQAVVAGEKTPGAFARDTRNAGLGAAIFIGYLRPRLRQAAHL